LVERINVPVSIDTRDVSVARAALDAGAAIVNDITALADDRMAELVTQAQVPIVLMHMQGTPGTMQDEPRYDDVVGEVLQFLLDGAAHAEAAGIAAERIWIDPGIGFGKTLQHNLQLLKRIDCFVTTGYRVLVGMSRKRFIGAVTGHDKPADRIFGTAATVAHCAAAGVSVVRVHDVAAMSDVVRVTRAVLDS
jgi:dihydropteroate synthase